MIKKLLNKIQQYFVYRELSSHIAKTEFPDLFKSSSQVIRESHETYKVGNEFTGIVLGSKTELNSRMLLTQVSRDSKESKVKERMTSLAFDNLIQVDEE